MLEQERLETLFAELVQTSERAKRDYAADALLAALWVETGKEREVIAGALCGVSATGGGIAATRLCRKFGAGEENIPVPPPSPSERRRLIGEIAFEVGISTGQTLAAYLNDPADAESEEARIEVQCLYDLYRLMELLRLPKMQTVAIGFLMLAHEHSVSWYPVLQKAICRGLAVLPLTEQKLEFGLLSLHNSKSLTLLPMLDFLDSHDCVPELARCLRYSSLSGISLPGMRSQPEVWEQVVWGVLKALERLGDRRALPELKGLLDPNRFYRPSVLAIRGGFSSGASSPPRLSPELKAEVERVIQAIKFGRSQDRETLLRPSSIGGAELLRPSAGEVTQKREREELLRPGEDEGVQG